MKRYECGMCKNIADAYAVKCPVCHVGTLTELKEPPALKADTTAKEVPKPHKRIVYNFCYKKLNDMTEGGLRRTNMVALTAAPGVGKSTLLLQLADDAAKKGLSVIFVSAEMALDQVGDMISRLGLDDFKAEVIDESDFSKIKQLVRSRRPDIVIIDSLQELHDGIYRRPSHVQQNDHTAELHIMAKTYGTIFIAVSQVNRDLRMSGPEGTQHGFDAIWVMRRGFNNEVILSTPTKKNRLGPDDLRAVFCMTERGLVEKPEIETGFLLRHDAKSVVGVAAFPSYFDGDYSVDEISVVPSAQGRDNRLRIVGGSTAHADFLLAVMRKIDSTFSASFVISANRTGKITRSADLGILVAIASKYYTRPIAVDTAFMAEVDADGSLLPTIDMHEQAKRAFDQGYNNLYGPRRIGSDEPNWTEKKSVMDVLEALGIKD